MVARKVRFRRHHAAGIALFVLVAILATSCREKPTPPVTEEQLRSCPRDDRIWLKAIAEAEAGKRLEALRQLADEVALAHPERWEPLWAAGECVFRTKPPMPSEVSKDLFQRALERAEALNDPVGISRSANRLGVTFFLTRDDAAAEPLYRKALAAAEAVNRDDLKGLAQLNLAGLLQRIGRLAEAMKSMEAASTNLRRSGRTDLARTLSYSRAVMLEQLGQLSEAKRLFEQVYDEATKAGANDDMASYSIALGQLHLLLNDLETARSWFGKVPADHNYADRAALGLGRIALRERRYDEAELQLDRAIAQHGESSPIQLFITFRAEVDLRTGNPAAALARLAPILEQAQQSVNAAWMAPTVYGRALMQEGSAAREAVPYLREAVQAVEERGAGLDPSAEGMTYLRERAEPYVELARALALQDGDRNVGAVLGVVEQAHARSLRQLLREEGRAPLKLAGLESLQGHLAGGEILLDFLIGEDHGVVLAVGHSESRVEIIDGWSELRPLLQRYGAALRRPLVSSEARLDPEVDLRRDIDIGKQLRERLLGGVESMIAIARRIYVVPDQDLALLPFAALPAPNSGSASSPEPLRFLGDDKEIALLPMAGTPATWSSARSPLLLAGDPIPDAQGEFTALPLAATELKDVEAVWMGEPSTRLQGETLLASKLRELDLGRFNTLHFATHAVASSRDPRRCAVILSRGERLGMQEIAALQLGPALIVLSACQTGEGEVIPGEGVVGLSWSFLRAGARGVVASLWSVEDASTTELMVAYHRALKSGSDPIRALSLAQNEISRSRQHPVYWAPFVVIVSPSGTI